MQFIRQCLQNCHTISQQMVDFKAAFEIFVNWESQLPDTDKIEELQEDFPDELLYSGEGMRGPKPLFQLPRDHSALKGFEYNQYPK